MSGKISRSKKYAAAFVHVKNEEEIIGEWMAFHRAVGFEHLIVLDNGSTDSTATIVKRFREPECVTYIYESTGYPTTFNKRIMAEFRDNFEWIASIDADEFLYPTDGGDIRNTIANFSNTSGIGVYWQIYGSSGHASKPEGLVVQNFSRRAASDYYLNRHIKSIVRPNHVIEPLGSHVFKLQGNFVDAGGKELHFDPPFGYFEQHVPDYSRLRINHYHTLSRKQYEKKAKRGYFGIEDDKLNKDQERFETMWNMHNMNEVEDKSASEFVALMQFYLDY